MTVGVRPSVDVRQLDHAFGTGELRKQVLFDNELAVYPGEIVIMTGPSGSGKTTLLTLIGTLRRDMYNDVTALKGICERCLVEAVRHAPLDAGERGKFEPTGAPPNRAHIMRAAEMQHLDDPAPDESAGADHRRPMPDHAMLFLRSDARAIANNARAAVSSVPGALLSPSAARNCARAAGTSPLRANSWAEASADRA